MTRSFLLVTAHPEPQSFNHALKNAAIELLSAGPLRIQISDLYQTSFAANTGIHDFFHYPPEKPLDLLADQKASAEYGGFALDIQAEQQKLQWADVVILQFPLWWGTFPAVLKGWIERVLTYGFAYGRSKTLPARTGMLSVTTGGAADSQEEQEHLRRVQQMADDIFGYMHWQIRPPFLAHGPADISAEDRTALLHSYREHLRSMFLAG